MEVVALVIAFTLADLKSKLMSINELKVGDRFQFIGAPEKTYFIIGPYHYSDGKGKFRISMSFCKSVIKV